MHALLLCCVFRSSDNAKFASCGGDRVAYYWDVATSTVLKRLRGHTERINSLAFSGDDSNSVLVTASYDKTVKVWDNKYVPLTHWPVCMGCSLPNQRVCVS